MFLGQILTQHQIQGFSNDYDEDSMQVSKHLGIENSFIETELMPQNTIEWEMIGFPETLDPQRTYDNYGYWIADNVYETLFTYPFDSPDTSPLVPLLAEDVIISTDGTEYLFKIRQDVTFHDGTSFNASCIKYNIERVLAIFDPEGPAWMIAERILGGQIVEDALYNYGPGSPEHIAAYENWLLQGAIEIVSEYEVKIKLENPYAPFLQVLATKVGSMMSPTWVERNGGITIGLNNEYVDWHTCGTGPYMVSEIAYYDYINLIRNDAYWRASDAQSVNPNAGFVKSVTIRTNDDTENRISNLIEGDTDGCYWGRDDAHRIWDPINKISLHPEINVYSDGLAYTTNSMGLNLRSQIYQEGALVDNPFTYIDLRRALSYSFNYQKYIDDLLLGLGVQAQGPVPIGMFGHNDDLQIYEYDIDLAVQAWNDAMAAGLDQVWVNNFCKLTLYYNTGSRFREGMCRIVKAGIEAILDHPNAVQPDEPLMIELIDLEWNDFRIILFSGQLPIVFAPWIPDFADPSNYVGVFCQSYATWSWRIGYNNPVVDQLSVEALQSQSDIDRIELYRLIQDMVVNDIAYVWIAQFTDFHVERTRLNGYSFNPMRQTYFYNYWIEEVEPPEPIPNDIIIWETVANPKTLDPHRDYEQIGNWISSNVYETLLTYSFDSADTETFVPLLAESYAVSEDGCQYTFSLRHDVTFHDGTPFNASCVKDNIERLLAIFDPWGPAWMIAEPIVGGRAIETTVYESGQGSDQHRTAFNEWKAANDAGTGAFRILDPYTIQILLEEPFAPFLHALSYYAGAMISPTWVKNHGGVEVGLSNEFVDNNACGTGPYEVSEWVLDDHITLVKNTNYWRAAEALAANPFSGSINTITIRINRDDSSREMNLLSGMSDGCYWPRGDINRIWNFETQESLYADLSISMHDLLLNTMAIGFNLRENIDDDGIIRANPFSLSDLRTACSYAFDYNGYIQTALGGLGAQLKGLIPYGMFGYDESIFTYSYDIDFAVEAWNNAMNNGLDSILAENDYSLTFYYPIGPSYEWIGEIRTYLVSYREKIGRELLEFIKKGILKILDDSRTTQPYQPLSISVIGLDWDELSVLHQQGRLLLGVLGWAMDYPDPSNFAWPFAHSSGAFATRVGLGTSIGWPAETVDLWITQAARSHDLAERTTLYHQIQQALIDQVAYIWCYQPSSLYVERANLRGYVFNPTRFGNPYFYNYWKEFTEPDEEPVRTSWWWKREFSLVLENSDSTYTRSDLQELVRKISYSSEIFSGVTTLEDALSILEIDEIKGTAGIALRELYAIWLNLANNAFMEDTVVHLSKLTDAITIGEAILECESILQNPSAVVKEIIRVMRIGQEINAGRY
jgi:peptide/nickel transport system substrate-binding protein